MKNYKRHLAITAIFIMAMCGLSLVNGSSTVPARSQGITTTPATKITPYDAVPGWENIIPGVSNWTDAKAALLAKGYQVTLAGTNKDGSITDYGVIMNQVIGSAKPTTATPTLSSYTDVTAVVGVQTDDKIAYIGMGWYLGLSSPLTPQEWSTVNPSKLVTEYGTPDEFFADVIARGDGIVAGMIMKWNHPKILMELPLIRVSDNYFDTFSLCLTRENVRGAKLIFVSQLHQEFVDTDYYRTFEQVFTPKTFRSVPDLKTLGEILKRGECLQTDVTRWVTIDESAPTRLPAPTFTPTPSTN